MIYIAVGIIAFAIGFFTGGYVVVVGLHAQGKLTDKQLSEAVKKKKNSIEDAEIVE